MGEFHYICWFCRSSTKENPIRNHVLSRALWQFVQDAWRHIFLFFWRGGGHERLRDEALSLIWVIIFKESDSVQRLTSQFVNNFGSLERTERLTVQFRCLHGVCRQLYQFSRKIETSHRKTGFTCIIYFLCWTWLCNSSYQWMSPLMPCTEKRFHA